MGTYSPCAELIASLLAGRSKLPGWPLPSVPLQSEQDLRSFWVEDGLKWVYPARLFCQPADQRLIGWHGAHQSRGKLVQQQFRQLDASRPKGCEPGRCQIPEYRWSCGDCLSMQIGQDHC